MGKVFMKFKNQLISTENIDGFLIRNDGNVEMRLLNGAIATITKEQYDKLIADCKVIEVSDDDLTVRIPMPGGFDPNMLPRGGGNGIIL